MADVELNSIGNGDGTNYLVRDNTKIPLSGSNAISGSLIPATDNAYNLGSSSYRFANIFSYGLYTSFIYSYNNTSQTAIYGGTSYLNGAEVTAYGKDHATKSGCIYLVARDGTNTKELIVKPDGTLSWNAKNVAMQEDVVPRSGGAVMGGATKVAIARSTDSGELRLDGGTGWDHGSSLSCHGKDDTVDAGAFVLNASNGTSSHWLAGYPNGTLTWGGQPVQTSSDARLKQQIAQIDDDLLTAWEDVNLVQFKYNDAVEEKSDNARLHTGYVVQQIDEACKSHGVDVSKYGLYCHEEYAEETREVEHEDGTKTTEVVRPASEHYSLRYTEALIVECAYLRKKNKDLQEQLNALSERLEKLENR